MGCASSAEPQQKHPVQHGTYPKNNGQQNNHAQQPQRMPQQPQQPPPQQKPPQQQPPQHQPPPYQEQKKSSSQPTLEQKNNAEEKTDIEAKEVTLDKKILERYIELEKQMRSAEGRNVIKTMKAKEEELVDLNQTVKQLQTHYEQCTKQTDKEKADVDRLGIDTIKNFFSSQSEYDATFSKEQEEYLDALNKQEIAKKELDGITKQRDQVQQEVKDLTVEANQLQQLYVEQDELLASIFNGKYGSEREYQLECELDMLQDRKQRISVAKYKWQNARTLLQHAVNQLAFSVKRWGEVGRVQQTNLQVRYTMATETRNNIIAASQNITSAQRYLHTIQFPYCKPPEVDTLNRAVNNIYSDMTTTERHHHSMQCYSTTHKRAAALLQWFDHVISNTIVKDFDTANKASDDKSRELRAERLVLIKAKMQGGGEGENIDISEAMDMGGSKDSQKVEEAHAMEADKVSNAGDIELPNDDGGAEEGEDSTVNAAPTPMPDNELAPAPKSDELFGDIDELKKQHEAEMQEFAKAQDVNKARMEQGLQEKLRARRSRRVRQETTDALE